MPSTQHPLRHCQNCCRPIKSLYRKWLISSGACISQTPRSQTDNRWTLTSHVSLTCRLAGKDALTSAPLSAGSLYSPPHTRAMRSHTTSHTPDVYSGPDVAPSESENAKRMRQSDSWGGEGSRDGRTLWENRREEDMPRQPFIYQM